MQHVAIVALMGKMTVLPFLAPMALLLAAATLPLRRIYIGIVLAVAAILVEAALADIAAVETMRASGLFAGSILFLAVIVVISVLPLLGALTVVQATRDGSVLRRPASSGEGPR